jgi:GNAT superfamily N-acetyltransferase
MIRPAQVEDIRSIYDMIEAYFHEAVRKRKYSMTWDRDSAVIYLGNLLWSEQALNFVSQDEQGVISGAIMGQIGQTWFGPNTIAQPHILYVKPDYRNGLIARALLRRFEKAALERNALYVLWEFESGVSDHKMLSGLMENLGYDYQGGIYQKQFI